MIILTSLQRDYLDRFYTEYMKLEPGYAFAIARKYDFTNEHFNNLERAHHRSWGNDWGNWGPDNIYPPLSNPPPDPPIFPWPSIQDLENDLQAEETEISSVTK